MKRLLLPAFLLFSSIATAHTPVCRCELKDSDVICTGQFHDGSAAVGIPVTVFDLDNNTLVEGQFDKQSSFRFTLPQSAFYIIMNAGAGEMFEVEWKDVHGLESAQFPEP